MDQSIIDAAISEWKSFPRLDIPPIVMKCYSILLQEVKKDPSLTTKEQQLGEVKRLMEEAIPADKNGDELIAIKKKIEFLTN